jgi:transposase
MNPFQGILQLADLQDDFEIIDYKKWRHEGLVELTLNRKLRAGRCSECGTVCDKIHSTDRVTLRDLSAFGYRVIIRVQRFTVNCPRCARAVIEDHWLWRPRRQFTWRYECHVSLLCEEMTNAAISRLEKLNDKTVYRIDYELLQFRLQRQTLPALGPDYSMDEVYFRYYPNGHPKKEQSFVTNLLDLEHGKIISNAPGRSEKSAENCLIWLSKTQRREAESVATDLHEPYHRAIRRHCPNANIVLDRFHIMQLFSEAMDTFRKKQLELAQEDLEIQLLKGQHKKLLLTRPERLSKINRALLGELKKLNERVVEALLIREYFIEFFQSPTVKLARLSWYRLMKLVQAVDIPAFNEFFSRLKQWLPMIWNYFLHKTSSGTIEAINHKIKTIKAVAYGYRNIHYFQLKILQRAGFLNSKYAQLPNRQPKPA